MLGIVTNEVRTRRARRARRCSSRRRSAARASGSCSSRRSRARRRSSPRTSRATRDVVDAGGGDARPAGRCSARSRTRSSALLADEPRRVAMGRAARAAREERYSWPDVARRLEEIYERVAGVRRRRLAGDAARVAAARLLAVAISLIWWRGPDWTLVRDAFTVVRWRWVVVAIGLNLLSVRRPRARLEHGDPQAMPPPHPRFRLVFSAFCGRALRERRAARAVGELARVAVLARRMPRREGVRDAGRLRLRAPRLRPLPGGAR